jgi:transcriptional regulator with XRE-family HTH domain
VGRHSKDIQDDAPGRSLAEFMRQLRTEARLTWREIADKCYISHTTLSQNADGRLTPTWAPIRDWFNEFYRAMDEHGIELSWSRVDATTQARKLWEACRAHQKELERAKLVSAPPAMPGDHATVDINRPLVLVVDPADLKYPWILNQARPPARILPPGPAHAPHPASNGGEHPLAGYRAKPTRAPTALVKTTIGLPGIAPENLKRVTPDSLYRVSSVSDIVASLNDVLTEFGFDISQLARLGRLTSHGNDKSVVQPLSAELVRDVLTGRYPPTPGIIRQVIAACGGTPRDLLEWETITTPLLEQLPARGRAAVRSPRRPRPRAAKAPDGQRQSDRPGRPPSHEYTASLHVF